MPYKTKEAQRERNQRYLAEHREENKRRCKANYEANKEARKQKMREWHATHKEQENAKKKVWRDTHPEEAAARHHRYYVNNPEKVRASKQRYNAANPEKNKIRHKTWAATHRPQIYKSRKRRTDEIRREVLGHYGVDGNPVCVRCGYSIVDSLVIDHVNGGGNKHRHALGLVGRSFYAWLKRTNYPPEYQTLCYNCNNLKIEENNERNSKYREDEKNG
jgi:hypothetical protein